MPRDEISSQNECFFCASYEQIGYKKRMKVGQIYFILRTGHDDIKFLKENDSDTSFCLNTRETCKENDLKFHTHV
jgi:hypothetical protein